MKLGERMRVSGVLRQDAQWQLTPIHFLMGEAARRDDEIIVSDYRIPAGIKKGHYRALVTHALDHGLAGLEDSLPGSLAKGRGLMPLVEALREVHCPRSAAALRSALRRLSYNTFLCAALQVRAEVGSSTATAEVIPRDDAREESCAAALPFPLTTGQAAALEDALQDMASPTPMRRLVQGDVGCGKTAVAALAVLNAAAAGHQCAFLAPTEVPARQVLGLLESWAAPLGISTLLLVGGNRAGEKKAALAALAGDGGLIAVGTHALFQQKVAFGRLGLVVVDEQHRFGVLQRLRLLRKGGMPHLLAMSATPIPRTLALTLYADLRLSSIRKPPAGRQTITTHHHVRELHGPFDWASLARRAAAGEKMFIVFPGIESDQEGFPTLLGLGRRLAARFFRGIPVAAIHGKLSDVEKQEKLEAFRRGSVHVLFATTVIEVGVDIPDARVMVVVGADRFGLAQLHQLRGRVGRGKEPGECWLLTRSRRSADSERLMFLTECHDGFRIAERDLELRGPGDMMGLRQHGPGPLQCVQEDEDLLQTAVADAEALVKERHDWRRILDGLGPFVWRRRRRHVGFMDAG